MMQFAEHFTIERTIPNDMCIRDIPWLYLACFTILDPNLLDTPEMVAHELQASLYNEGSMCGSFQVASIKDGKAWVVFIREGCEVDYHRCYGGANGHDGTHEGGLAQCDAEIRECMFEGNTRQGIALLRYERLTDRAMFHRPAPYHVPAWGEDWGSRLSTAAA